MTAARKRASARDTKIDDLGVLAIALAEIYTESLRVVATSLGHVLQRRDAARLLAGYVVYARDMEDLCESPPVGFAQWLRVAKERA